MLSSRSLALILAGLCLALTGGLADAQTRKTPAPDPAPGEVKLTVTTSTTEVPDLAPWADDAKRLCEEWYPKIAAMLPSEGFTPPDRVRLVFLKDMKGVAATGGNRIMIAANWVKEHPDDRGMVIHELTHVVQSYPRNRAGWLVEGIADWIRFVQFEPDHPQPRIDPERSSYRQGYRTTFRFLEWARKTYDKDLIVKLNKALRQGHYNDDLFKDSTGKTLDELWKEFVATLPKRTG
jgi:hypothetical protein